MAQATQAHLRSAPGGRQPPLPAHASSPWVKTVVKVGLIIGSLLGIAGAIATLPPLAAAIVSGIFLITGTLLFNYVSSGSCLPRWLLNLATHSGSAPRRAPPRVAVSQVPGGGLTASPAPLPPPPGRAPRRAQPRVAVSAVPGGGLTPSPAPLPPAPGSAPRRALPPAAAAAVSQVPGGGLAHTPDPLPPPRGSAPQSAQPSHHDRGGFYGELLRPAIPLALSAQRGSRRRKPPQAAVSGAQGAGERGRPGFPRSAAGRIDRGAVPPPPPPRRQDQIPPGRSAVVGSATGGGPAFTGSAKPLPKPPGAR